MQWNIRGPNTYPFHRMNYDALTVLSIVVHDTGENFPVDQTLDFSRLTSIEIETRHSKDTPMILRLAGALRSARALRRVILRNVSETLIDAVCGTGLELEFMELSLRVGYASRCVKSGRFPSAERLVLRLPHRFEWFDSDARTFWEHMGRDPSIRELDVKAIVRSFLGEEHRLSAPPQRAPTTPRKRIVRLPIGQHDVSYWSMVCHDADAVVLQTDWYHPTMDGDEYDGPANLNASLRFLYSRGNTAFGAVGVSILIFMDKVSPGDTKVLKAINLLYETYPQITIHLTIEVYDAPCCVETFDAQIHASFQTHIAGGQLTTFVDS